ncbi:MAG: SpoIIE family protein phosphatase [Acidobacteria bacterium]|nr:SpoIIE family protein phosphatase [Acidobacteriota bacterium]
MPRLIVKSAASANADSTVELQRLRTTIGRSVRNDLWTDDPFTSRLHAEIRQRGDGFWLSDLGSANGTFLNGTRLTAPVMLKERDVFRVGETEIVFVEREETSPMRGQTGVLIAPASDLSAQIKPEATIVASARNSATAVSKVISSLDLSQSTVSGISQFAETSADILAVISRVSVALLSSLSLDETLNQVLDCVFEALPADHGYLMLFERIPGQSESELICKAMKTRKPVSAQTEVKISHSISEQVLKQGSSVLTSDAQQDPRFQQQHSIVLSGIRSVMAVPLAIEGRILGMIYVDSSFGTNRFNEPQLQLLTLIAGVAAIRIDNARLLELQSEQERLANELSVASEIQLRLHPANPPKITGYDMIGVSFPCYEVGGDYFDFIERKDGRYVVALGDVSGKGTGAALLMSSLHAAVRAYVTTPATAPEVVSQINQYIYDNTPSNRYITFFYSELNPKTHELTYVNAGHNPPLLVRASGQVEKLEVGGFPVGIMPFGTYEQATVSLRPGDVMIVYSDGVTESINEAGDEFGENPLIEVLKKNLTRTAAGVRDRIDEALTRFVGKAKSVDDLTMVIVKRVS